MGRRHGELHWPVRLRRSAVLHASARWRVRKQGCSRAVVMLAYTALRKEAPIERFFVCIFSSVGGDPLVVALLAYRWPAQNMCGIIGIDAFLEPTLCCPTTTSILAFWKAVIPSE